MSIDLGKTRITEKVYVSSAALRRADCHGPYWLVETWIFSDDPRQRNRQVIHGTCSAFDDLSPRLCGKAARAHRHIAENLKKKFGEDLKTS